MNEYTEALKSRIASVIVGNDEVIEHVITALIAGGHVLLEDLPGTGKTMLAKSLAGSINAGFARIQFTPDLLPSDITGIHVYRPQTGDFELKVGPVFAQILLADEINRATPRTQAALLECMEEHQVTLDGETLGLNEPFFVIATQNPIENAGTFPLPEAQLDRFFMKLSMGSMSAEDELAMLERFEAGRPLDEITPIMDAASVLEMKAQAEKVFIHPVLKKYIVDLCRGTREMPRILAGASPRAELVMMACAKALAYVRGRDYVVPEDIKELAVPVLSHRLVLSAELKRNGGPDIVVKQVLKMISLPTEDWRG